MNNEIEKIKARIRALASKTVGNGCSESEAESAIRMVGKLLSQYNLSMDEVEIRSEKCVTIGIDTGSKHRGGVYFAVYAISQFTGCKVWCTRLSSGIRYVFFGRESDVLVAKYLFDVVDNAIKHETEKFKQTPGWYASKSRRAASSSFVTGMGYRLAARITEMMKEHNEEVATAGGTALMVIKDQVVEAAFADLNLKMRKSSSATTIKDGNAYNAGQKAANNVNLSRAVSASSTSIRLTA